MKKLLTSLATITLIAGSVVNVAAFKQISHRKNINAITKKVNGTISNEDAEDIASKLFHKTIKLDPNVWLGKNLATEQKAFNGTIVKQGILTADEAKYVTWNSLQINVAGWYRSKADFTVKKDGASATGNATINASLGETSAEIAAKLSKATIQFNYSWWKGKTFKANFNELKQIIINEQILTPVEATEFTNLTTVGTIGTVGEYIQNAIISGPNGTTSATIHIKVVNDGLYASEIANKISGGTFYLHGDMWAKYADSTAVTQNLDNYLANDSQLFTPSFTQADAKAVSLSSHVRLHSENSNLTANIVKDGQTATSKINVDTHNYPEILTQDQSNSNFGAVVNLPPQIVNGLKQYFLTAGKTATDKLECFYNTLDDDQFDKYQYVGNIKYFKWSDRLEALMGSYGDSFISALTTAGMQGDTDDSGNKKFEEALANKLANTPNPSWLTVYFHWYYAYNTGGGTASINTTEYWGFW